MPQGPGEVGGSDREGATPDFKPAWICGIGLLLPCNLPRASTFVKQQLGRSCQGLIAEAIIRVLMLDMQVCGRKLRCGNHKCPAPCHSGPCQPCPLTAQVCCACGGQSYRLPCGAEGRAQPPSCPQPCPVPALCRHASTSSSHVYAFLPSRKDSVCAVHSCSQTTSFCSVRCSGNVAHPPAPGPVREPSALTLHFPLHMCAHLPTPVLSFPCLVLYQVSAAMLQLPPGMQMHLLTSIFSFSMWTGALDRMHVCL